MSGVVDLILVNGWGASADSWQPLARHWPAHWRVEAIELPGHGARSTERGPFTVARAAEELGAHLAKRPGSPVVLVGHSMGGQITSLVHAANPQLVRAEIVIDPAYGHPESDRERLFAWYRDVAADAPSEIARFVDGAFSPHSAAELRAAVHHEISCTPSPVLIDYLKSEYFDDGSVGMAPASRTLLARRRMPVLGVYSTEPAAEFERAAGSPHTRVWAGQGHYLHLEDPARLAAEAAHWLADLPSGQRP